MNKCVKLQSVNLSIWSIVLFILFKSLLRNYYRIFLTTEGP